MPKGSFARLLLVVPGLLYVSVALHWRERLPAAGDEPHYLIIAESILRDGDLKVVNDYEREEQHPTFLGRADRHSLSYSYSVHNPGFALLVAVPFRLGGVLASRLFVACLMGALPFLFFVAAPRRA